MSTEDSIDILYFTASTQFSVSGRPLARPEWTHLAFSYQNTAGTFQAELYINFKAVNVDIHSFPIQPELVPKAFMVGGLQGPDVRGFGVMDELLIFDEYLSASQIAQLKDSSALH